MDRKTLTAVSALVALSLFFGLYFFPMLGRSGELEKKLQKARKDLAEITSAAEKYALLSARLPGGAKSLAGTGKRVKLSDEVGGVAQRAGLSEKITKMVPRAAGGRNRQEELSVSISRVSLPLFVRFLEKLHNLPSGIVVRKANIVSSFEDKNLLDIELTLTPAI